MENRSPHGVRQFLKFLCFSLGAGVIEAASFAAITLLWQDEAGLVTAEVTSVVLSCLFNFTLTRRFTFQHAGNVALGMLLYGAYYAIATPAGAALIVWLTRLGLNEFLAKAIKMVLNFALDFTYCKFVIFRRPAKTQK